MKCLSSGLTDPGLVRSVNQDAYYIDPDGQLFIVADGMGGHAGGQEASRIATETVRQVLFERWSTTDSASALLTEALEAANTAILTDQETHPERSEMGTTVVAVIFRNGEWWCAHVGDSRLYRWRDRTLEQLTEDHTWVARAVKYGDLDPQQARSHPWRHVLMQCLGRPEMGPIDIQKLALKPGDRLLLCSDGLTEELPDDTIAKHLNAGQSLERTVQVLVDMAKQNGGRDNITVTIVALPEGEGWSVDWGAAIPQSDRPLAQSEADTLTRNTPKFSDLPSELMEPAGDELTEDKLHEDGLKAAPLAEEDVTEDDMTELVE